MKYAVLSLTLALTIAGCSSKELTRPKAAKMIQQFNEEPDNLINRHRYYSLGEFKKLIVYDDLADLKRAERAGWVVLTSYPCQKVQVLGSPERNACPVDITFTEKGKAETKNWKQSENSWTITIMHQEVIAVTGINAGPNAAVVQFTWHWAPTEYGKQLGFTPETEQVADRLQFQLFDDGWRITGIH